MTIEQAVMDHYGRAGIAGEILAAIGRDGVLTTDDFAPYDEFHIGGRTATAYLTGQLGLKAGMRVLDIGSGIGGPARYVAEMTGAHVTGIDLTPDFVEAADILTGRSALAGRVAFRVESAIDLSFADGSFDGAYMIHVGMNIQDKDALFAEAFRVLKPGSVFGIYDILAGEGGDAPYFPLPWASAPSSSFLAAPDAMRSGLRRAGFDVVHDENRRDFALGTFEKIWKLEREGTLHTVKPPVHMADYPAKILNLARAVEMKLCAPWVIVCRKT